LFQLIVVHLATTDVQKLKKHVHSRLVQKLRNYVVQQLIRLTCPMNQNHCTNVVISMWTCIVSNILRDDNNFREEEISICL